jgi:SynChlorMet cassette protein ScmD
MIPDKAKLVVNPSVVFREEFDDRAILFDPDSGETFGLNAVGMLIWKCLDGRHTMELIVKRLYNHFDKVPEDAKDHVQGFIQKLVQRGFIAQETP